MPDDAVMRFGGPLVVRALLGALARRYDPASGFRGRVAFAVRFGAQERVWTIVADGRRARVRRGGPPDVTVRVTAEDLVLLARRELDAGSALLDGRLDVEGDLAAARSVGPAFGLGSVL